MSLARELVVALAAEFAADPELAREFAEAFAPYLGTGVAGAWMDAAEVAVYLGLTSPDALDRLVKNGLPCSQPSGRGGHRYFHRARIDAWMEGHG